MGWLVWRRFSDARQAVEHRRGSVTGDDVSPHAFSLPVSDVVGQVVVVLTSCAVSESFTKTASLTLCSLVCVLSNIC